MNGTALSSPSTSSQRSDSSLPLLRVAASQTTDTMGKNRRNAPPFFNTRALQQFVFMFPNPEMASWILGDDEFSSPSQDTSGLEEVVEQLNNTFPHSQGTKLTLLCF